MTQLLKDLGATGNNPNSLSSSRVTMYVAVAFYMIAAVYVLVAGLALPHAEAEGARFIYRNAESAANLVFDKMWILLGPYLVSAVRDGAVRVAEKRNGGGSASSS